MRYPVSCSIIAATCFLAPFGSFAQNTAEPVIELPTFTVTAQMREQAAVDVPIALSVYDGEFLDSATISDMDEFAAYVPNFEMQEQSPNNPGFVIRGITSDDGDAYEEPRVSVFKDGVSISKSRGSVVKLYDISRVEVLKGPQSTLFGRGASSGAVSLISARPQPEVEGMMTFGLGNYDERYFEGMVNMPLSDTVYFRVAGLVHDREGYLENLSGGELNGTRTFALRPSLRIQPSEDLTVDFIFDVQYDNPPGISFKQQRYPTSAGTTSPYEPADLNRGEDLGVERTVWSGVANVEYALTERLTLTSITGYREYDSYEEFDADGSQAYFGEFAEDAQAEQWSQEVRLNYEAEDRFEGFVGASYFWQKAQTRVPFRSDERSTYTFFSPLVADSVNPAIQQLNQMGLGLPPVEVEPLIHPDGSVNLVQGLPYSAFAAQAIQQQLNAGVPPQNLQVPPPNSPLIPQFKPYHEEEYTNFGETSAVDLFADGTYHLTEALSLTAGVRVTYEEIESGYRMDPAPVPSVLGSAVRPELNGNLFFAPTNGTRWAEDDYTSAVGRVAAQYAFSESQQVYATVSKGRRPPVIQNNENGVAYLPAETLLNYEIGGKAYLLNRRAYIDAALFTYEYSDFATTVLKNLQRTPVNAGNATAYGAEISGRYILTGDLTAFANYGYVDATFDDTDDAGNPQEFAGNRFRLTPEHSFLIGLELTQHYEGKTFFLVPSYHWKSKVYFENNNRADLSQDAYGIFDVTAGVRWDRYELSFYFKNLFDEEYLVDAGNSGDNFGLPTYIMGPPRFFGARFTARF